MIARYRILAEADIRHEYYADGACEDFILRPSTPTEALLSERRLRWKVVGSKLLVLAAVDEAGRPVSPLPADLRLVFHMDLAAASFLAVSNVEPARLRSRRFHFTNLAGNAFPAGTGQVLHLTRPVAAYDAARAYVPGEFVRAGGDVWECAKAALGQDPAAPGSEFWVRKGAFQYAAGPDMLPFLGRSTEFSLATPARAFRIRIFGLDASSGAYTSLIREDVVQVSPLEAGSLVRADLSALPPGRYRLDINGETFEAWFDDEAVARGSFGVIELFGHLPATDPYALLDAAGTVRETAYVVRFGNRRAYWKYLTPLHKVEDILVAGDHAQPTPFEPGSDSPAPGAPKDFFVSKRPLPLTERAADNLFELKIGSDFRPAPKPDPRLPGMLTQSFDSASQTYLDYFCTIRLNN